MNEFLIELNNTESLDLNDNVFNIIRKEYERVILRSLITTFGLDFIITDQNGGDVDTILNVRKGMYKSPKNQQQYENRQKYDYVAYHKDYRYQQKIQEAKKNQEFIPDAYVPDTKVYYGKASFLREKGQKANLDHVIPAHEINEDPGRILAGLNGVELANSDENLRFTNESINKSKSDKSVQEFIAYRETSNNPLSAETKDNLKQIDLQARKNYNDKIDEAYYFGDKFIGDSIIAASKLGIKMGIRQATGFMFIELYTACKAELEKVPPGCQIKDLFGALVIGIDNGYKSIKDKYKELLNSFGEGFFSGVLSSIATTLINIFITTDRNTVRNLRQVFVCVTQAGNILLFNPNNLLTGDRIKFTALTLATGASSLIGLNIGDLIDKTPIASLPELCTPIKTFISTMVSGLLSCSFLIILDRSNFANDLIDGLNKYKTTENILVDCSKEIERISAELQSVDLYEFSEECKLLNVAVSSLKEVENEIELTELLEDLSDDLDIIHTFGDDFDSFMSDKNNKLVFK